MTKRNILLICCKSIIVLVVLLMLLFIGVMVWIKTAPRSVTDLTAKVIEELQSPEAPFELSIDDVRLEWQDWAHPAMLRLGGIRLRSAEHDNELTIPSGNLSFDFPALLLGDIRFSSLELEQVALSVGNEEGEWQVRTPDGKLLHVFAPQRESEGYAVFPVTNLALKQSTLNIEYDGETAVLDGLDLSLSMYESGQMMLRYDTQLKVKDQVTALYGDGQIQLDNQEIRLQLQTDHINPIIACDIIDCAELPKLDMAFAGAATMRANPQGLQQLNFTLQGKEGSFAFLPHFPETLEMDSLAIRGEVDGPKETLEIDQLDIAFKSGTTITANGAASQAEEGFYLDLKASAVNMPVNDLYKYWPDGLAPQTREWAITRIREGMATEASAIIHITPEYLGPELLPDEFLKTEIHVQDTTVNYIDGFPIAENANGIVRFTGTTMVADIETASAMKSTNIKKAKIVFTDLNAPGTPVEIDLSLTSTPQDTYGFMEKLPFHPLKHHQVDVSKANGTLDADVSLAFDAFSGDSSSSTVNWDALKYHVKGETKKLDDIRVRDAIALSAVAGTVAVSNDEYDINLRGKSEGRDYQFTYDAAVGKSEVIGLKGALPAKVLHQQVPESEEYLTGTPLVDVTLSRKKENWSLDAKVDLTQSKVMVPPLGYEKASGEEANLLISTDPKSPERISWSYLANGLDANGKLQLNAKQEDIDGFELTRYRSASQDFELRYQPLPEGGFRADVSGRKLDLTPLWRPKEERRATISDLPPVQLQLNLQELQFPQGGSMKAVNGHIFCSSDRCISADLKGDLPDDGSFKLFIGPMEGKRQFRFQATQTGALLHMLDIHDKLYQGTADIKGIYDDAKKENPLTGRAIITNFVVKDGPILFTILNNGSLTGLADNLSGDGIRFEKFSSDFVFANDLLSLKDAKAAGPSIGLIIDGEINIGTNILDLSGNLAPAHVINSLVGKIPLIGQVLVGGKGESIFAIDYSIKGPMDDPSIVVNPLSALTPGFTRRFFDIFETPPDTTAPDAPKTPESPVLPKK